MELNIDEPKYWRLLINQSLLRFFLLQAISKKGIHGYALQSLLSVISNGLCKPSQGTIYPALNELEKSGYLKSYWERKKGRKRKIYQLTKKGERALRVAKEVLERALKTTVFQEEKMPPSLEFKEKEAKKETTQLPLRF